MADDKILLKEPSRGWIAIDDCVSMDCDGPKHVLIYDVDGSLTGAPSSIHGRAEFMNEFRADGVTLTGYDVPAKMLNDPNPVGWVPQAPTTPASAVATTSACQPSWAIYDGACRAPQYAESHVAYKGFGMWRDNCTLVTAWNAWHCADDVSKFVRLVIESMDSKRRGLELLDCAGWVCEGVLIASGVRRCTDCTAARSAR